MLRSPSRAWVVLGGVLALASAPAPAAAESCAWTKLTPASTPSARYEYGMAFDGARGKAVLMGGIVDDHNQVDDETWEWDGTTWAMVSTSGPGARAGHAMAFDAARGVTVLVGGLDALLQSKNDTWTWNGTAWSNPVPHGTPNVPSDRTLPALVWDPQREVVVLWGGKNQGIGGATDDCADALWEWNGTSWQAVAISAASHAAANAFGCASGIEGYYDEARGAVTLTRGDLTVELTPGFPETLPATTGHPSEIFGAAAYDTTHQIGFLFDGLLAFCDADCVVDGTSVRRADTDTFTTLNVAGPSPRGSNVVVYDSAHDQLLLFGGQLVNPISNLPVLDGETWVFRYGPPELPVGPASTADLLCADRQFSANPVGAGPFTYQWQRIVDGQPIDLTNNARFSGAQAQQFRIHPLRPDDGGSYRVAVANACDTTASAPFGVKILEGGWEAGHAGPPREGPALAYDSARGRLVIFGGIANGAKLIVTDTTYELVAGVWTEIKSTGPAARTEAAMAYDPVRKVSVLYGGRWFDVDTGQSGVYGDTWEWDGTTWKQGPAGPGIRFLHAMVWDSERQRIEMFGGRFQNLTQVGDLWEYDGTHWTPRTPGADPNYPGANGLPTGREDFALAYDDGRKALVLFGGNFFSPSPGRQRGETWELVGNQWTMRSIDPVLADLAPGVAGYHGAHHQVAMFIGPFGGGAGSSTWTWNGTPPWQRLDGAAPTYRSRPGAVMAYDSNRRRLAMYGGFITGLNPTGDEPELAFADGVDPTCGAANVCGDGIVDSAETCDPFTAADTECCHACQALAVGTGCNAGGCNAVGSCVGVGCGDGMSQSGEACDDGGAGGLCCTPTCNLDNAGACGDPCVGSRCAAGTCVAGSADTTGCSAATSAAAYLDGGGTLVTPDGSALLQLPAGAGPSERYAIASGLGSSGFGIGTAATRVLVTRFEPTGTVFTAPGATITLRWHDVDDDGFVDGVGLAETSLTLFHDGVAIATCAGDPGCSRGDNSWTFVTTSFSEFAIVGTVPCATFAKPKLTIGKMLAPAGDDSLSFAGVMPAPASAPDPDVNGLHVRLDDAHGAVVAVTLPAGAYAKATKIGWKVDKKRTKWTWSHPKIGAPSGLVKVTVAVNAKKHLLTIAAKGAAGAFATTAPVTVTIAVPGGTICGATHFDEADQGCVLKSKGKSLACK